MSIHVIRQVWNNTTYNIVVFLTLHKLSNMVESLLKAPSIHQSPFVPDNSHSCIINHTMTTSPQWRFKSNKYKMSVSFYLQAFSNSKSESFVFSSRGFAKPSQHFPKISGDFLRFLNITKTVQRCTDNL